MLNEVFRSTVRAPASRQAICLRCFIQTILSPHQISASRAFSTSHPRSKSKTKPKLQSEVDTNLQEKPGFESKSVAASKNEDGKSSTKRKGGPKNEKEEKSVKEETETPANQVKPRAGKLRSRHRASSAKVRTVAAERRSAPARQDQGRSRLQRHIAAAGKSTLSDKDTKLSLKDGSSSAQGNSSLHARPDSKSETELKASSRFEAVEVDRGEIPRLAHGLSRVLFNQGVVQFRDAHSRVYNFDPNLELLPPIDRIDFTSLGSFIPPSKDLTLAEIAKKSKKRYIGSTSSMTGLLKHFHFLLSGYRELNFEGISRLCDDPPSFTKITKAPDAVILRYNDGVYAVDHDKEFDSSNILSLMGTYLEKYLTTDRATFEGFKIGNRHLLSEDATLPDSYNYSTVAGTDLLIRSQLDAVDPRLPGTGVFDLKTRAVLPIRMSITDFEFGMNYELRTMQGKISSFEKEFVDMARSTLLKYSLQVRLGRMDGIFVAYHNIARIFGFQYMTVNEMDKVLHGTDDRTLGDWELSTSLTLLNELFRRATEKFPKQSLRIHCDTPELRSGTSLLFFIEPVTMKEVEDIQSKNTLAIAEWERQILGLEDSGLEATGSGNHDNDTTEFRARMRRIREQTLKRKQTEKASGDVQGNPTSSSDSATENAKDQKDIDSPESKPLLAFTLKIRNTVNGTPVLRPMIKNAKANWKVAYSITEMTPDSKARRLYEQTKRRRKALFTQQRDENSEVDDFFRRQLKHASESDKIWREKLDKKDKLNEEKDKGIFMWDSDKPIAREDLAGIK